MRLLSESTCGEQNCPRSQRPFDGMINSHKLEVRSSRLGFFKPPYHFKDEIDHLMDCSNEGVRRAVSTHRVFGHDGSPVEPENDNEARVLE